MVKNNNECCGFELKAKPRLGQPRSVKIRKTALLQQKKGSSTVYDRNVQKNIKI